jgi:hypothetical protein
MHRRSTDELERRIAAWEAVRRTIELDASPAALAFVDAELGRLRRAKVAWAAPRIWGRRASDPKPALLMLRP